jgi:hypothetical protein
MKTSYKPSTIHSLPLRTGSDLFQAEPDQFLLCITLGVPSVGMILSWAFWKNWALRRVCARVAADGSAKAVVASRTLVRREITTMLKRWNFRGEKFIRKTSFIPFQVPGPRGNVFMTFVE